MGLRGSRKKRKISLSVRACLLLVSIVTPALLFQWMTSPPKVPPANEGAKATVRPAPPKAALEAPKAKIQETLPPPGFVKLLFSDEPEKVPGPFCTEAPLLDDILRQALDPDAEPLHSPK